MPQIACERSLCLRKTRGLWLAMLVSPDSHGGPQGVVQIEGNNLNRDAELHVRRAEHVACTLPFARDRNRTRHTTLT